LFDSLLIANRGEIACRIVKTCRRLGIRTIAVYSDADRDARHVRLADEAVYLGPPPATESYLVIEKLLDAARRTGAAAIHPGYGFLSESPAFARAVRDAGLVFVGPPPEAMERLGGKDSAKALLEPAGVPLVPGYHGAEQDDGRLEAEAGRIGFPLLIKATAGGGGKGMRKVEEGGDFAELLAACRREARASFGDDRVLLERYIERPRHVEVQVFADRHGNAVHLFERDCTLQRRHQKIIEEAPAPGLPAEMRAAIGRAATEAALAAGYENAGTVEFLLDQQGRFYFIEMNTRLQVEHPVTEAITALDLVEWQLRIAAGEPLPLAQDAILAKGHAFEARLYAEDPAKGFLPSIGTLHTLDLPHAMADVRVDTGVEEGDAVTPFYDPMIAKIIAWGADRAAALERLAAALDATQVAGVTTNLGFLRAAAASPAFRTMTIDTGWLDREGTEVLAREPAPEPGTLLLAALATVALSLARERPQPVPGTDWTSPWHRRDAWRLNQPPRGLVRLLAGQELHIVTVEGTGERFTARLGERSLAARCGVADGRVWIESDGHRRSFPAALVGHALVLTLDGRRHVFTLEDGRFFARGEEEDQGLFTAPMPGKVTKLLVGPGDVVKKGQPLAVLEAMKMESRFEAPRDGVVAAVHVREGEQVEEGTVLLDLASPEEGTAP
jgi:3-methylcrotonyl-CoA carboxylase alpha subunit